MTSRGPSAQKELGLKGLAQDTDTISHSTLGYRIYHLISSVQLRHSALPYSTITHDGSSHEMCMACVVLNVRSSFRWTYARSKLVSCRSRSAHHRELLRDCWVGRYRWAGMTPHSTRISDKRLHNGANRRDTDDTTNYANLICSRSVMASVRSVSARFHTVLSRSGG